MELSIIVIVGVAMALAFDFLNGMNDAANSIATVIATRVLSLKVGILWAASFDMLGALIFGVHVATTVGKGIVDPAIVTPIVVVIALGAAIVWTYTCTRFGLPISVSHALIGGLCGVAIIKNGTSALLASGIIKVAAFIVLSPIIGMTLAVFFSFLLAWLVHRWPKRRVEVVFSKAQLLSSAAFALSHGSNDAQKTMGIISVLLFSAGLLGTEFHVPTWVIFACTGMMGAGTMIGGWRVIRTMGSKITPLRQLEGFGAETAGAMTVIGASMAGIPVSTTHTIAGCIVGVGLGRNARAIRWKVAKHIVGAWFLTIPVTGALGAIAYYVLSLITE